MSEYLIRLNKDQTENAEILNRLPLGSGVRPGSISEEDLQSLVFRHPKSLPISEIDPTYEGIVPICKELNTQSGYIDALFVNPLGRIVLVEFKLWRNPEARREVIGQILDYAKDLASWSYEDLQTKVSLKFESTGNVLFKTVRKAKPGLNEREFVDNVSRNLRRGEFLLLIVGDGIREGVENIVSFVQRYSGLNFNLALVETSLYNDEDDKLIIHPHVLARTEILQRFVIEGQDGEVVVDPDGNGSTVSKRPTTDQERENLRFWKSVRKGFAFSDPTIETRSAICPDPATDATLFVRVINSSFNGWALCFGAFLNRSQQTMGCYLTVRKDQAREVRIYESLRASIYEHREEIGEDLEHWYNPSDRPRLGYTRAGSLAFLSKNGDRDEYRESVTWMRTKLNLLVSHLHPKIQTMLVDNK